MRWKRSRGGKGRGLSSVRDGVKPRPGGGTLDRDEARDRRGEGGSAEDERLSTPESYGSLSKRSRLREFLFLY